MVGFTDLAESLEPEELAEVLNGYLREMTAAVIEFGGSVDNLIGDGVMAVFGAPQEMAGGRTGMGGRAGRDGDAARGAASWPPRSASAASPPI